MTRPLPSFDVFNLRRRSLARGTILVLLSFAASFPLSGFPQTRATPLLIIPAFLGMAGTLDTLRCMRPQRDLYHAGIILCLFMDMLAVCLILFFLLFPYVI
ncbi:MAG: permease [Acidobacteriota bacterium]|nr:permease [Acidobacteriota bacterium]